MNIAAASKVKIGSESGAAKPYRCAAEGCLSYTADNYCAAHQDICDECDGEWMAGDLKPAATFRSGPGYTGREMWCPDCERAACRADAERFLSRCFCGSHSAVRA